MSSIGMTVHYRSGTTIGQKGTIEQERVNHDGRKEFYVRFADGRAMWLLAQNVTF